MDKVSRFWSDNIPSEGYHRHTQLVQSLFFYGLEAGHDSWSFCYKYIKNVLKPKYRPCCYVHYSFLRNNHNDQGCAESSKASGRSDNCDLSGI